MARPNVDRDDLRMVRAALAYAERLHWFVFPLFEIGADGDCACPRSHPSRDPQGRCGSPGKHPRTPHGVKDASSDPAQIKRWWAAAPQANIGIAVGRSGLVVLDIDPRNGGDDALRELEALHGPLPVTPQQLTGGGGVHFLFARPDLPHVRGPKDALGRGIDVKADGGYIVAAPSNHYAGGAYAWEVTAHPMDLEPVPLPAWVLERLDQRTKGPATSTGAVRDGFLGRAFDIAGWLGRPLGLGKAAVRCPWEDEHTGGTRFDGSTIVFAPQAGHLFGWWWCSHAHCQGRKQEAVLAALPASARTEAKAQLGLAADYDGARERASASRLAPEAPAPDPDDWHTGLVVKANGKLEPIVGNAIILLGNLPAWAGCLEYDAFADEVRWARPVPDLAGFQVPDVGAALRDHHAGYVQQWLAKHYTVKLSKDLTLDAILAAAHQRVVHPLRTYLASLTHDGAPRLARWLTAYLGVEETPYSSAVGVWWLVSAIARAMLQGCQADHVLVLEGPQGQGKSDALRILGGQWYLGALPDIHSKDARIALRGRWLVEIAELDAFRRAEASTIKAFVSEVRDSYRPPYGRNTVEHPRSCVFVGTTNAHRYMQDATGGRRFWPVTCGRIDRDALRRDRDQLIAEARDAWQDGVAWWPTDGLSDVVRLEQADRYEGDEWEETVVEYVAGKEAAGVTVGDVLTQLGVERPRWGRGEMGRVGAILRRLGWSVRRAWDEGKRIRVWIKDDSSADR